MQLSEKKQVLSREEIKRIKCRRARARTAVLTVFVLLIISIVGFVLLQTVLFPIQSITTTGNYTVTSAEIIKASGVSVGDKLFSVSQKRLNRIITVEYPYIKSVKIKYPSLRELRLDITETEDLFCYKVGTSFFTADVDNKILSEASNQPENTVLVIHNSEINPQIGYLLNLSNDEFKTVKEIYELFDKENIELNTLNISNTAAVELKVKGRFVVYLGSLNDLEGKFEHLKGMLPEIDAKNGSNITGEIDLSAWSSSKREGFFKPKTLQ